MSNTKKEGNKEVVIIDFYKILNRMLSLWWLFLLCIMIGVGIGHTYLRYTTFEYASRAILLIKDAGRSGNISEQSILLTDQGISGGGKAMDNEIQILKSVTLMEKVVERLDLDIAYYRIGNVKETELYHKTPFFIDSVQLQSKFSYGNYYVELSGYDTFIFKKSLEDEGGLKCKFGIPFQTEDGSFRISLNPEIAVIKGTYKVYINSVFSAASQYKSNLLVTRIGNPNFSSVLEIKLLDPVGKKAADIINTLIDVYNEEEIKDENTVFRNTLEFIDNRVGNLVLELDSVEGGIQQFKSANEIIGDNAAGSMDYTLGEIRKAVQQISDYDIQKNLLESLEGFLAQNNASEYKLIPANLIAENPVLSGLVNQFNGLVLRYNDLSKTASDLNPTKINLETQMEDIRGLILETIQNLKKDIQIPIAKIEQNLGQLKQSLSSVPGIEKRLVEKMRTQAVKEKLFLYLLQKREDTALSEAVTTAKTRTIDHARVPGYPVYPKKKMIWVFSGILGFIVPAILIFLWSLFETKVDSEETIKQLTTIPILGRIAFNKGGESIVVKPGNRSAINEMFRLLRTKLNFLNHGKAKQKILVTSSISGEGKTFTALNLGITLALSDKKVLLMGLDLRKPKLAKYINASTSKGVTNYLVGQCEIDEIIQVYDEQENLHFVTSGPTPPNPAELILSERMTALLEILGDQYDYILIDTPPVGLVSDALLLRDQVDTMLVVVHQRMTKKVMLRHLERMNQEGEIKNASIVFNGVKNGKSYYGYGGYKQGYYVDEAK